MRYIMILLVVFSVTGYSAEQIVSESHCEMIEFGDISEFEPSFKDQAANENSDCMEYMDSWYADEYCANKKTVDEYQKCMDEQNPGGY